MAKTNYRQAKRQKEIARKAKRDDKVLKRETKRVEPETVPDPTPAKVDSEL